MKNTHYGNEYPTFKNCIVNRKYAIRVPYDIIKLEESNEYAWNEIIIESDKFEYGEIVNAIIHTIYSDSQMTAIINNYLLDDKNTEYKNEFLKMQEQRKRVKETAKEILDRYSKS